jgi:hypothetical protein
MEVNCTDISPFVRIPCSGSSQMFEFLFQGRTQGLHQGQVRGEEVRPAVLLQRPGDLLGAGAVDSQSQPLRPSAGLRRGQHTRC